MAYTRKAPNTIVTGHQLFRRGVRYMLTCGTGKQEYVAYHLRAYEDGTAAINLLASASTCNGF